MKKLLLILVAFMLAGCVAYPLYDDGYYYPSYGPYPYGYWGSDVSIFVSDFHGGHGYHRGGNYYGGHGYYGGGGYRGGGSYHGGGYHGGGGGYHGGGGGYHRGGGGGYTGGVHRR